VELTAAPVIHKALEQAPYHFDNSRTVDFDKRYFVRATSHLFVTVRSVIES